MALHPKESTPEHQSSQEYLEFLQRIKTDPCSPELWHDLRSLACREERRGDGYSSFSEEEIVGLADLIIPQTDISAAFHHFAQKASNGEIWYDIIFDKGNRQMFEPVVDVFTRQNQFEWGLGIDLGTGTGSSLVALSGACRHAIGIDKSSGLLAAARKRNDYSSQVSLVEADITNLGFLPNNSVDIAVSNGLRLYLSRGQFVQMASELRRVLKLGGSYFFASGGIEKEGSISDDLKWLTSPKALMIGAIVARITSLEPEETISESEEVERLIDLGFEFNLYGELGVDDTVVMELYSNPF